ncbi:MAG: helix-turn-helix domain-containing protein [Phycisphaerae bacterium]
MKPEEFGIHLERMRSTMGLGLRELGRKAGMSPGALSAIEKGQSSPTLATLHKILRALGTDFAGFFATSAQNGADPVFEAKTHRMAQDAYRQYVFLFPKREDMRFEMVLETILPTEKKPEWETHDCDLGGYIISGGPVKVEIEGVGKWTLKKGDSFYIKSGHKHRATNMGNNPLKMVTTFDPPRY